MKKAVLGLCAAGALSAMPAVAIGGPPAYMETFDSYPTGTLVTCSLGVCSGPNNWTCWDNSDGASGGLVNTTFANSAPNSLSVTNVDDMVVLFDATDFVDGVYNASVWVYITGAQTDNNYFIMLNQYEHGAAGVKEWSLDLEFDAVTNKVRDFESGSEIDLITDAWVQVEVIMNLNDDPSGDTCTILYGGTPVGPTRQWSQGGTTTFQAFDLWGDSSTVNAYYDDLRIDELPETGACCLPTVGGDCTSDSTVGDCATADGNFQGFGSLCAAAECDSYGADGWIVEAPFEWADDSGRALYQSFPCDANFGFNSTVQWEVTLPYPGNWTFSVCGTVTWDTIMGLGSTACDVDLALNDDGGCVGAGSTDSAFTVELTPGTYYLTLAGTSAADFGAFNLTVDAPGALNVIPGSIPEGESDCVDDNVDVYNSGCNDPAEAFLPVECGDAYLNSAGRFIVNVPTCTDPGDVDGDGDIDFQDLLALLAGWSPDPGSCVGCAADVDGDDDVDFQDLLLVLSNWTPDGCPTVPGSGRDTDWWLFELAATTEISYTATGTFPLQMLLITLPGADVTEGCANLDIPAFALPGVCDEGNITRTLDAGRYALWGGPQGGTDPVSAPCGSLYNFEFTCTP